MNLMREISGKRLEVFLDSSVILAGIGSETGASGVVLDLCEAELMVPIISKQVVIEVDRAVSAKLPHLADKLRHYFSGIRFVMMEDPPVEKVRQAAQQVHLKDAPILAAAQAANADYLVTLDKKHFLKAREKVQFVPPVLTPGELLRVFEKWCEKQ
jgi:predicted nucleic acid-binding protein